MGGRRIAERGGQHGAVAIAHFGVARNGGSGRQRIDGGGDSRPRTFASGPGGHIIGGGSLQVLNGVSRTPIEGLAAFGLGIPHVGTIIRLVSDGQGYRAGTAAFRAGGNRSLRGFKNHYIHRVAFAVLVVRRDAVIACRTGGVRCALHGSILCGQVPKAARGVRARHSRQGDTAAVKTDVRRGGRHARHRMDGHGERGGCTAASGLGIGGNNIECGGGRHGLLRAVQGLRAFRIAVPLKPVVGVDIKGDGLRTAIGLVNGQRSFRGVHHDGRDHGTGTETAGVRTSRNIKGLRL